MVHSCPVTEVGPGPHHASLVAHPPGATGSLNFFFFFFKARVCNFLRQLSQWTHVLARLLRNVSLAHAQHLVSFQQTSGLVHPRPSSSARPFLHPYIALPTILNFSLLAGSKSPKWIKRHIFFKDLLWSPSASWSWSESPSRTLALWWLLEVSSLLQSCSSLTPPHLTHTHTPTHTLAFLEIDLGCFSLSRDCSPVAEVLAITLATFYSFVGTPHVPLRWLLSLVLRQPRTTYTCYVF